VSAPEIWPDKEEWPILEVGVYKWRTAVLLKVKKNTNNRYLFAWVTELLLI